MSKGPGAKLKAFLRKPYPHQPDRWIILILVPLFVSLFMVTFQPFGLQMLVHEHKNLLLVGYGFVTFLVLGFDMYVLPLIIPKLSCEEGWLVINEVLYLTWIVLSISIGNYFYSVLFSIASWHGLYGLMVFIGFTFAIAIIPTAGIIVFSYNYLLRKNLEGAREVTRLATGKGDPKRNESSIQLVSGNGRQEIQTTAFQLLCIESVGNYVNTWNLEEGKIVHRVIRNTLKNIEEQLRDTEGLFRCHRAYIVNLRHVVHAEGNSQGYRLRMNYLEQEIPVSRNYTKAFNKAFRDWQ